MPTLKARLLTWCDFSLRKLLVVPLITASFTAALGLFGAPQAVAQENEERWYRIELLIFANEGTATAEQWPATPDLAYPEAARFLVDPQQVEANREGFEGTSDIDSYGRQILGFPVDELSTTEPSIDEPSISVTPTPFITLPTDSREFYGKAAYMQRSGNYTTLFHESWVQPVQAAGEALPIIIDRSGDTQQWPELQGSIKLHIARYLHLETNLWLNTPGDYLPGEWRMPAPPLGPLSLIIEEPDLDVIEDATSTASLQPALNDDAIEIAVLDDEVAGTQLTTEPTYPWRHAVLLDQSRRMRSGEVHYIDHPMLGVVIKLTPLDAEQLLELADAEALAREAAEIESSINSAQ